MYLLSSELFSMKSSTFLCADIKCYVILHDNAAICLHIYDLVQHIFPGSLCNFRVSLLGLLLGRIFLKLSHCCCFFVV